MFASSQYPVPSAQARAVSPAADMQAGEGRHCEAARQATAALLLPQGRASGWLLLLAGSCVYVVVQALALRLA